MEGTYALEAGYRNWSTVAGYFDGDGNAEERVGEFVITPNIGFCDNWPEQLGMVRGFLVAEKVGPGALTKRMWRGGISAWQVRVSNSAGILIAVDSMLPFVFKKKAELTGLSDYLHNKITGDELVKIVNHEVEIGNKVGKMKTSNLPFTRSEGTRRRYEATLGAAHEAARTPVSDADIDFIRRTYATEEITLRELSSLTGYSVSVVWRVLGHSRKQSHEGDSIAGRN